MEQNKYIEYFNIIKDLHSKRNISIEWFKDNFRFSSKIDLEDHLQSLGDHLNIDEFKTVVLEVVTLIRDIAIRDQQEAYDEWKVELVQENLLTADELAHIYIISTTNVETIKTVNQEILTKRSEKDIDKTIGHSLLLTLEPRNNPMNTINFELSKMQLRQLIKDLEGSLSDIEKLEKARGG